MTCEVRCIKIVCGHLLEIKSDFQVNFRTNKGTHNSTITFSLSDEELRELIDMLNVELKFKSKAFSKTKRSDLHEGDIVKFKSEDGENSYQAIVISTRDGLTKLGCIMFNGNSLPDDTQFIMTDNFMHDYKTMCKVDVDFNSFDIWRFE